MPEIVLPREIANHFLEAVQTLRDRAELLSETIAAVLPPETPDMLSILLPPTNDLSTAAALFEEIEKVLSQAVVNPYIGGEIRLVAFDQGSLWVEVALRSAKAVALVAGLLTIIQQVELNQAQVAAHWQAVRTMTLRNDAIESEVKALDQALAGLADQELEAGIADLAKECGVPDEDHEYRTRLKVVTKELSDMITRGLEIHPALDVPAESRVIFPVPSELAAAVRQLSGPDASSNPPKS